MTSASATTRPGPIYLHADPRDVDSNVLVELGSAAGMGVLMVGAGVQAVRRMRACFPGLVGVDAGVWRAAEATVRAPMPTLAAPDATALFPITVDQHCGVLAEAGADLVLTPSGFVRTADWATLRSLLRAARRTDRPEVATLVPTDAEMLDEANRDRFLDELADARRPLALIFAGRRSRPFGRSGRIEALRRLMATLPGLLVLATEHVLAADVAASGHAASVGFHRSLRCPGPPAGPGPSGMAKNWLPGLFLRELWESRSPAVYADWYAFRATSPYCVRCDRQVDDFEPTEEDRRLIRRHNLHELAQLLRDMSASMDPLAMLREERLAALKRHIELHPFSEGHRADEVLRCLVELDDPQGRQLLSSGAWAP